MNFWKAIFLGVLQGLTEFFPVSSSGHLAIAEQLLKITADGGLLFDVLLHAGTLAAVIVAFRRDILRLIVETVRIVKDLFFNLRQLFHFLKTQEEASYRRILTGNYRKLAVMIMTATVPTAIIGALLQKAATAASLKLIYPGMGLLITGIILLVVDRTDSGNKIPKDVPLWQAFLIGVIQGLAVFPGVSRSGATICSGLLCGLSRRLAVRFSFLLSIPAVIGAMIFELASAGSDGSFTWGIFGYGLMGGIMAGAVGYFCVKKMLVLVQKKKLRYFAYYCFAIGVIAMVGYFALGEA
jgi:undecaprenyl-diphosphatase